LRSNLSTSAFLTTKTQKLTKTGHRNSRGAILRNFAPVAVNLLGEFPFSYGFSLLTSLAGIGDFLEREMVSNALKVGAKVLAA
jgi:hypothetical protein